MTVHEVRVLYGAVGRREYVTFDDGITDWVKTIYMRGQCLSLAVELHKRTDWPIVIEGGPWEQHTLGPYDKNGLVIGEQATDPTSNVTPTQIIRNGFRHAMVLSPNGLVDIHGCAPVALKGWDADRRAAYGAPTCTCPPACACTQCCLQGHERTFLASVTLDTALTLDQAIGTGRQRQPRAALPQNYDAAATAADLLLQTLGWSQTPTRHKITIPTAAHQIAAASRTRT